MNAYFAPNYLGILGGGQLGRYFTQAAQDLGYSVCVLDPDLQSPAGQIAQTFIQADYLDPAALKQMAQTCVAISTEFENVPAKALDTLMDNGCFVAPLSHAVSIAQNRKAEKEFLSECAKLTQIPPAPYHPISSSQDCNRVSKGIFPAILKTTRLGYDGKGQKTVLTPEDLIAAWMDLGQVDCVLEKRLPLSFEVSAIVARTLEDEVTVFPIAQNIHRNGILHLSIVPAPSITQNQSSQIVDATKTIVRQLNYVGVLCIEFFVTQDGQLIVNEIAPRPHNSGHHTLDSCFTSQFEQQVRTLAKLPLGNTDLISPVVMLNLLGDIWLGENGEIITPKWDEILALSTAKLHLYGKSEPKPGRKMGHINFLSENQETALEQARLAMDILGIPQS